MRLEVRYCLGGLATSNDYVVAERTMTMDAHDARGTLACVAPPWHKQIDGQGRNSIARDQQLAPGVIIELDSLFDRYLPILWWSGVTKELVQLRFEVALPRMQLLRCAALKAHRRLRSLHE